MGLEVVVNDPFNASLLGLLFLNREDLLLAAPRSKYPFCIDEWTLRFQKHPENCSLLFYLEQKLVGHTSFLPNSELLYLCYVILLPEFRGTGYASEMIRLSEEFCRLNYPHDVLHLNVNRSNSRALKLYKNLGYEICAEIKEKYRMKKALR